MVAHSVVAKVVLACIIKNLKYLSSMLLKQIICSRLLFPVDLMSRTFCTFQHYCCHCLISFGNWDIIGVDYLMFSIGDLKLMSNYKSTTLWSSGFIIIFKTGSWWRLTFFIGNLVVRKLMDCSGLMRCDQS